METRKSKLIVGNAGGTASKKAKTYKASLPSGWDGERFFDFIKDGIMNTKEINRQVNFDFFFSDIIDGKRDYIFSAERFRELLTEKYLN